MILLSELMRQQDHISQDIDCLLYMSHVSKEHLFMIFVIVMPNEVLVCTLLLVWHKKQNYTLYFFTAAVYCEVDVIPKVQKENCQVASQFAAHGLYVYSTDACCNLIWLGVKDLLLASCPWGPATAHGVGLLTEMYAVYTMPNMKAIAARFYLFKAVNRAVVATDNCLSTV